MPKTKDSASGVVTDDPTDRSDGVDSANHFFLQPTKHDILPLVLGIIVIALGVTAALLSFFLLRNAETEIARIALNTSSQDVSRALSNAAASVVAVVQATATFFQVSKTPITLYDQFSPYILSSGSFPKYLSGISYIRAVPVEETDSFVAQMQSMGGDYVDFAITGRDAANKPIPPIWTPLRGIVVQTTPIANMKLLNGYDINTDYEKNLTMIRALATGTPAATGRIQTATKSDINVATAVFQSITNQTSMKPYAIIAGSIVMNQLISEALSSISRKFYVSVFDTNSTSDPFVYSTASTSAAGISSKQNAEMISSAPFVSSANLTFGDRILSVTLIPQNDYIEQYSTSQRYIALVLSLALMVVLLIGVVILYFTRKLLIARQKRRATSVQIDLLKTNQTALRVLLDRIANQESKTRAVINSLPDLICVITATGKILQTNQAFDHEFPFNQQEMEKGVYTWDIFTELSSDFFRVPNEQGINTTAARRFGGTIDVCLNVRSLGDFGGSSTHSNDQVKQSGSVALPDLQEAYVLIAKVISHKFITAETHEENLQRHEFERKYRDKKFRDELKRYCEKNKTVENVLFLERVKEYKKAAFNVRVDMKKQIFEQFVQADAPMQLNLANQVIVEETIKIGKSMGDVDVFKNVEECVIKILANDIYPRFQLDERKASVISL
jgi:PAS domain-containing protein